MSLPSNVQSIIAQVQSGKLAAVYAIPLVNAALDGQPELMAAAQSAVYAAGGQLGAAINSSDTSSAASRGALTQGGVYVSHTDAFNESVQRLAPYGYNEGQIAWAMEQEFGQSGLASTLLGRAVTEADKGAWKPSWGSNAPSGFSTPGGTPWDGRIDTAGGEVSTNGSAYIPSLPRADVVSDPGNGDPQWNQPGYIDPQTANQPLPYNLRAGVAGAGSGNPVNKIAPPPDPLAIFGPRLQSGQRNGVAAGFTGVKRGAADLKIL